MVLRYRFEYLSNNNDYLIILDNILKSKELKYKILRDENIIELFIEDKEENLIRVSDELSQELPLSIFLKDFTLEVVPQIPPENYHITLDSCQKSYCSNCLAEIENKELTNYYNPFISCQVCGATSNVKLIDIHKNNQLLSFENFEKSFNYLVEQLVDNKRLKVVNSKMQFTLQKLTNLTKNHEQLLCTDVEKLSTIAVGSKQKNIALLSYEKPTVQFNINTIYKNEKLCEFEHIYVNYAWDLVLYILARELRKHGIYFLSIEEIDENSSDFDIVLSYENSIKPPKISFCDSRVFILENSYYDSRLDEVYKKFDKVFLSQFMVLLDENILYEKSILNIFFSSKHEDAITLYSPKVDGFVNILEFKLPKTINSIFHEIVKQEGGKKLLENYKNSFPSIYDKALKVDIQEIKTNSIFSLWKIVGVILGIDDIFSNSFKALLQKGPSIDYKLKKSDKIFNKEFDFISLIKSGMSFKLAGVDEKTLSLGYVENYFYMLSNLIDEVNEEHQLDGISLCGDLIAYEFIDKLIHKTFSKSLKLYYNKDFPIQL